MRTTSTQRNGRRYAYYVCLGGCGARLNSSRIEESVLHQLEGAAGSRRKVRRLVRMYGGREGIVSADVMDKLRAIVASITAILNSMSLPVNAKPNPPAKSSTLKATAKEYVEQPVLSWGKPTVLQSAQ